MNESFYQMYKSGRDLIADFYDKDLGPEARDFIDSALCTAERLDRSNPEYFKRWENERFLLFRFHKRVLSESMETVQQIDSFEHLLLILVDYWPVPFNKVTIEPYVYDDRIKWDTHIVCVHGDDKTHSVGFLNKKPTWSVLDYEC